MSTDSKADLVDILRKKNSSDFENQLILKAIEDNF
jgi:hypothetical protein